MTAPYPYEIPEPGAVQIVPVEYADGTDASACDPVMLADVEDLP